MVFILLYIIVNNVVLRLDELYEINYWNHNMKETIKSVFADIGKDIKFDKRLLKEISKYVNGFITKNEDSIHFFGDTLIGVYPVKFVKEDRDSWFDDVLELDDLTLKRDLHSLPSIDPKFVVSSDVTNLTYIWLVHGIYNSKHLSVKEKEYGMRDVISMMHFKFISSLMSHYFKYPADKSVAMATYASLSRKFSLKVHGSWAALVRARTVDILSTGSIHFNTFTKMTDDDAVLYMVTDIQSRIREVIKKMMEVFYAVRDTEARIVATSGVINIEGESIVKDRSNDYIRFRKNTHSIITDRKSWIKSELLDVITTAIHTLPEKHLLEALEYMSDNYKVRGDKVIDELLDRTIVHSFGWINSNKIEITDIGLILSKLKTTYMSSRSIEPDLVAIRDLADEIVKHSVSSKNTAVHASVRTGLLLYVVLRTLGMKYYL